MLVKLAAHGEDMLQERWRHVTRMVKICYKHGEDMLQEQWWYATRTVKTCTAIVKTCEKNGEDMLKERWRRDKNCEVFLQEWWRQAWSWPFIKEYWFQVFKSSSSLVTSIHKRQQTTHRFQSLQRKKCFETQNKERCKCLV